MIEKKFRMIALIAIKISQAIESGELSCLDHTL